MIFLASLLSDLLYICNATREVFINSEWSVVRSTVWVSSQKPQSANNVRCSLETFTCECCPLQDGFVTADAVDYLFAGSKTVREIATPLILDLILKSNLCITNVISNADNVIWKPMCLYRMFFILILQIMQGACLIRGPHEAQLYHVL